MEKEKQCFNSSKGGVERRCRLSQSRANGDGAGCEIGDSSDLTIEKLMKAYLIFLQQTLLTPHSISNSNDSDVETLGLNNSESENSTSTNGSEDGENSIDPSGPDSLSKYSHLWVQCENEKCNGLNYKKYFMERLNVCEHCGEHLKMTSSERIELSIDPGTWDPMDEDMALDPIIIAFLSESVEAEETGVGEEKVEIEAEETEVGEEKVEIEAEETEVGEEKVEIEVGEEKVEIEAEETEVGEEKVEIEAEETEVGEEKVEIEAEETEVGEEKVEIEAEETEVGEEKVEIEAEETEVGEEKVEAEGIEAEEAEEPYEDRLVSSKKETGLAEAVETGIGQINGIPIAFGVMDFRFIGGSMGSVVGEKITRLIEYATNRSLPLIIVCASGGARMQEGSLSLIQMAKISSALYNYQLEENAFYISILTSPTTGGVTASFGMLGDIIIAEPRAYIAFAGKRVIEETLKIEVPEGIQVTENLFEKGLLDLIVERKDLKDVLSELFQLHGFVPLNQNSN
uniref:Acetyl-coenzyme A carboxylase carboxyl transferase subunit beta n=2 Tax=Lamprocapnos spectabilis TaxID=54415 RepID=A0A385LMH8_9MAGN|nr:acetyl-CoA carboxylase beta subunit [Lamprocapnos spectabilis]AYA29271.1 acetyl-CoA carboxylase beta subunit [Lamprocapnos spectabilis]